MDSMKKSLKMVLLMICVDLVFTNVLFVPTILDVINVLKVELMNQNVSVQMELLMMVMSVNLVPLNV